MKRLQTTQKRAYTSPVMEVLEAENDMPLLAHSLELEGRLGLEDMQESGTNTTNGGFLDEE